MPTLTIKREWLDLTCGSELRPSGNSGPVLLCQEVSNPEIKYAVFLNTPDDIPYVVGACCEAHLAVGDDGKPFPYLLIKDFQDGLALLESLQVPEEDLAEAVAILLDPSFSNAPAELLRPGECPQC